MRTELKKIGTDERHRFYATFEKFGWKNDYKYPKRTLLFKNVTDINGKIVTDHLWFNMIKTFEVLKLDPGDVIEFNARVKDYEKGYKGRKEGIYCPISTDYKLSYPSNAKIVYKSQIA